MPTPLFRFLPLALAVAAALGTTAAHAQQTVVITGNPLGRDIGARAASVLAGTELTLRRAATLGDTLDGLPGVAGSGFGPNSSRPVIRGLDGDRVRLLDNGGASSDASNLSFDHAVAADPLVAERIEVLRGPAALLYGGNATGGVVNVLDNRIPRTAADKLSGRAELRLGGAAQEHAGAAVIDGGAGGLAWHADVAARKGSDLRVPLYTPVADGQALEPSRRVRNSASSSEGGAVGASFVGLDGFVGLSVDTLRNRYGVTAEPDVTIRLKRDRVALGGEWRSGSGFVRSVGGQASATRYRHDEVEGSGEIGTTFKSEGRDLRLEMRHAPVGAFEGVWGVQAETLNFSALGEEAFVPGTHTQSRAVFALEEWSHGAWSLSAGARAEQVRVRSDGDPAGADPRFGAATERRFTPTSVSLGAGWRGPAGWQLQASIGSTERAPAHHELYANGLHVATSAFEVGDPQMALERSRHAELGLAWRAGAHHVKASLFNTRFANFIALDATGVDRVVPGENGEPDTLVPEYRFQGVKARLRGLELEGITRLLNGVLTVDLSGAIDWLRGDNLSRGEPLPRLAPTRVRLGLELGSAGWRTGLTVRHAAQQDRVPATDTATPASTLLDLWAQGQLRADGSLGWFARLNNATDRLAYNAVAVSTIRGLSPQAGRALSVGLTARW
ncbi:MAG: TonB-dependent receptor [Rubrivivax sp.]|nr:TonB-dependent receptor [Rubrivivax sp.]